MDTKNIVSFIVLVATTAKLPGVGIKVYDSNNNKIQIPKNDQEMISLLNEKGHCIEVYASDSTIANLLMRVSIYLADCVATLKGLGEYDDFREVEFQKLFMQLSRFTLHDLTEGHQRHFAQWINQ